MEKKRIYGNERITRFDAENSPALARAMKLFLGEENVTQEQIDRIADTLAKEIDIELQSASSERSRMDIILQVCAVGDQKDPDVQYGLRHVREAVLNALQHRIALKTDFDSSVKLHAVKHVFTYHSSLLRRVLVEEMHGGSVYKRVMEKGSFGLSRQQHTAIRQLQGILAEHPHPSVPNIVIAQENAIIEEDEKKWEHIQYLMQPLSLTNMKELLRERTVPPFVQALKYYRQFVDGVQFLSQRGLLLMDLSLDNIGIDLKNDRGVVFDLDALVPRSESTNYILKPDYCPPELKTHTGKMLVSEAPQVYELGVSLQRIMERIRPKNSFEQQLFHASTILMDKMLAPDPVTRPSLQGVKSELYQFAL